MGMDFSVGEVVNVRVPNPPVAPCSRTAGGWVVVPY
jgi:hypothetical protein